MNVDADVAIDERCRDPTLLDVISNVAGQEGQQEESHKQLRGRGRPVKHSEIRYRMRAKRKFDALRPLSTHIPSHLSKSVVDNALYKAEDKKNEGKPRQKERYSFKKDGGVSRHRNVSFTDEVRPRSTPTQTTTRAPLH